MGSLIHDVWNYIIKFIKNDKTTCRLLLSCKEMSKCEFYFDKKIQIEKILHSDWFNHFTNVTLKDMKNKLPASVNKISFTSCDEIIPGYIPGSITKINFSGMINKSIKDHIPNSIKDIYFGNSFNQPIDDFIPISVNKIILSNSYNREIIGSIPPSVTHITFGDYFNNKAMFGIPSWVTHLTFYACGTWRLSTLPLTVTHLEFMMGTDSSIEYIPEHLKSLIIAGRQYL